MRSLHLTSCLAFICMTTGMAFGFQMPSSAARVQSGDVVSTPAFEKLPTATESGELERVDSAISLTKEFVPEDRGQPDSTQGSGTR